MNETIMASLAAAKSNQAKPKPSPMWGFRSVRINTGEKLKTVRVSKGLDTKLPSTSTLTLNLEADVLRQLRATSRDPAGLAQRIIRDHLRKSKK